VQNAELWSNWLAPYEPQLPLSELVVELNKLFHQFEADSYDRRHPEILQQGAQLWHDMLAAALPKDTRQTRWRVLDFGCGTGFASCQLLSYIPGDSIERLVCYDLSPQMLQRCREKLGPTLPEARFYHELPRVLHEGPYNLLLTNSLLHHLPDPVETLRELQQCLDPDAIWLSGHEPSSRFFKNPVCQRHFELFGGQRRRRRLFGWTSYLGWRAWQQKIARLLNGKDSPKAKTAQAAYQQGFFKRRPHPKLIDRLVDFHVAHSASEAEAGRGFDYQTLAQQLRPDWRLVWFKSYSYMGAVEESSLPESWHRACQRLASDYPLDGAHFCSAWQRSGG
jgi:SAM-dependent methyltransferase